MYRMQSQVTQHRKKQENKNTFQEKAISENWTCNDPGIRINGQGFYRNYYN